MSANPTDDMSGSLSSRLLANSLLPALILLGILTGYYIHAETRAAEADQAYKTRLLAQHLAAAVGIQPDLFHDEQLSAWLRNQPERAEVARIEIHDLAMNLVASFEAPAAVANSDRVISEPILGRDQNLELPKSSRDNLTVEQYSRIVGHLRIVMSDRVLAETRQKILFDAGIILFYGFGFLALIGYCQIMLYSEPLREISARIQALLEGNFSSHNPCQARDELEQINFRLGRLASQLNQWQVNQTLDKQIQELRARGLERSLKEKAAELAVTLAQCEHQQRARFTFVAEVERELRPRLFRLTESSTATSFDHSSSHISEQVSNLLPVLDDLMSEWRSNPLELEMRPHVFDLRHCLESLMGLLAPSLSHLSLTLCIHPQVSSRLFADPTRLSQILGRWIIQLGLLMQRGMVILRVRPSQLTGKPGLLFLVHAPVGNLPPEVMQRMSFLFSTGNVFYTVDQGTRKATTVESVVRAMKGRHGITHRLWIGTYCYLYLPLGLDEAHQVSPSCPSVPVYVIDPVPVSRKAWVWRLQALGARVYPIASVANLESRQNDGPVQPAWVLINLSLSGYRHPESALGSNVVQLIQQAGAVPAVILPYGDLEGRDYYRKQGAVCFNQPVRSSELLEWLNGVSNANEALLYPDAGEHEVPAVDRVEPVASGFETGEAGATPMMQTHQPILGTTYQDMPFPSPGIIIPVRDRLAFHRLA